MVAEHREGEGETLPTTQYNDVRHALFLDLQFGQLLPESLLTAPINQSCRGRASIKITRSSANLAYSTIPVFISC
jgi:hypothetical protein